jgi:hypothetical protein
MSSGTFSNGGEFPTQGDESDKKEVYEDLRIPIPTTNGEPYEQPFIPQAGAHLAEGDFQGDGLITFFHPNRLEVPFEDEAGKRSIQLHDGTIAPAPDEGAPYIGKEDYNG